MGAALRLSGSFPRQHLETASHGKASSTPQGRPACILLTSVKGVVGAQMFLVTFELHFLENHLVHAVVETTAPCCWICVVLIVCDFIEL